MSPPPTNIDGTDITGATIDGQEVQEITIDGQTVFTAVPPSGISRWTFDNADITGSTLSDSFGSNDMTLNGMTTGLPGLSDTYSSGEAADLDGQNDDGTVPDVPVFNFGTSPYSVSGWWSFDGGFNQLIGQWGDPPNRGWSLQTFDSDLAFQTTSDGTNQQNLQASGVLSFTSPNHIVGTKSGTTAKLYINGSRVSDNGSPVASDVFNSTNPLNVGRRQDIPTSNPDGFADMSVDDIRLYSKELSATEVSSLYNTGSI